MPNSSRHNAAEKVAYVCDFKELDAMFLVVIKNMEHGYNLQNNSYETFRLYPVS